MPSEDQEEIFRKGSKTYYTTSKFFPKVYRDDVFSLYAFVRTADDYVDSVPPQKKEFLDFRKETFLALKTGNSKNTIIHDFVVLAKKKSFDEKDIRAFLWAMEKDMHSKPFKDFDDVDAYIHGSAEVIGVFMLRIFSLPKRLDKRAMLLGKAMQYINWLRDVKEDNDLGRQYIPLSVLKKYGFSSLEEREVRTNPDAFASLMRDELARMDYWMRDASKDFPCLPRSMRIPVMTASSAYRWTAKRISKNPFIVFSKKLKPSKGVLFCLLVKNWVKSWMFNRC